MLAVFVSWFWKFLMFLMTIQGQTANVKVDIFYESLCPDSVRFINNEIEPNYLSLRRHLDITFIPFGKSNHVVDPTTGAITFECQHGPDECYGNKVQMCAIHNLPTQDEQVAYVSCQMKFGSSGIVRDHQRCVVAAGLDWDKTLECVNSDWATETMLHYEKLTNPVIQERTNWVPTILYNGELDEAISVTRNSPPFRQIICDFIRGRNSVCESAL